MEISKHLESDKDVLQEKPDSKELPGISVSLEGDSNDNKGVEGLGILYPFDKMHDIYASNITYNEQLISSISGSFFSEYYFKMRSRLTDDTTRKVCANIIRFAGIMCEEIDKSKCCKEKDV